MTTITGGVYTPIGHGNAILTGQNNAIIGYNALTSLTSGASSTAFGYNAFTSTVKCVVCGKSPCLTVEKCTEKVATVFEEHESNKKRIEELERLVESLESTIAFTVECVKKELDSRLGSAKK